MSKEFKPIGYNSVSPYFVVNGTQNLIDLLKELFHAKEKRRYDMPDRTIMHVEVQIDDSIIMIGDASEQFPSNTHLMHVYVPDAMRFLTRLSTWDVNQLNRQMLKMVILTKGEPLKTLQETSGLLQHNCNNS